MQFYWNIMCSNMMSTAPNMWYSWCYIASMTHRLTCCLCNTCSLCTFLPFLFPVAVDCCNCLALSCSCDCCVLLICLSVFLFHVAVIAVMLHFALLLPVAVVPVRCCICIASCNCDCSIMLYWHWLFCSWSNTLIRRNNFTRIFLGTVQLFQEYYIYI